jgi:hypothetical protein
MTVHVLPGSSREEPVHEHDAADAERILEVLVRAGAETVD